MGLSINHRSLPPVLDKLRSQGLRPGRAGADHQLAMLCTSIVTPSQNRLVIGSEREGLTQEVLDKLDDVIEIPVYGQPASHNVVTATTMALYEYCRQYPSG